MGEHSDFFFRAHLKIRIGVCPGVRVLHKPSRPAGYKEFRIRARAYRADFMRKHGIRKLINELHPSGSLELDQGSGDSSAPSDH